MSVFVRKQSKLGDVWRFYVVKYCWKTSLLYLLRFSQLAYLYSVEFRIWVFTSSFDTFVNPQWQPPPPPTSPLPLPWVFASMISLIRPAPTLFFAASLTLYQVPQRRFSNLKERSVELMKTSFHSSVLSTEYWSTKPAWPKQSKTKHTKLIPEDLL